MTNYIVYIEDLSGEKVARWYYGTYEHDEANEVAMDLGASYPIFHCVCKASEAKEMGVKNLPF